MEMMSSWIADGEPSCFWLPGFFFPQVRLARARDAGRGQVESL
jgi:hypothetical protein